MKKWKHRTFIILWEYNVDRVVCIYNWTHGVVYKLCDVKWIVVNNTVNSNT